MIYQQCNKCMCVTCANKDCAARECDLCEKLNCIDAPLQGYPNVVCTKYKSQPDPDTECICCGATVPFGSVYCPNCLVTHVKS